jgi:hypothetical protein
MMMKTEHATPIAIPRFIPGNVDSSSGFGCTPGVSVAVGSGYGAIVAASRCSCSIVDCWWERKETRLRLNMHLDPCLLRLARHCEA